VKEAKDFWDSRKGSLIIAAVALGLVYAVGIRAIDTGSLQQYFLTFVLFVIAANRVLHAIFHK
jgi:hypothetical protein